MHGLKASNVIFDLWSSVYGAHDRRWPIFDGQDQRFFRIFSIIKKYGKKRVVNMIVHGEKLQSNYCSWGIDDSKCPFLESTMTKVQELVLVLCIF